MSLITQPERFSEEAWELLLAGQAQAQAWQHRQMDVEHLLLALLETPAGSSSPHLWPPPRAGGVAQL